MEEYYKYLRALTLNMKVKRKKGPTKYVQLSLF